MFIKIYEFIQESINFIKAHKEDIFSCLSYIKGFFSFTEKFFLRMFFLGVICTIVVIVSFKHKYHIDKVLYSAGFNDPSRDGYNRSVSDNEVRIQINKIIKDTQLMGNELDAALINERGNKYHISPIKIDKVIVVKSVHKRDSNLYKTSLKTGWSILEDDEEKDKEKRRSLKNYPEQYLNYDFTSDQITPYCGSVFDWVHKWVPLEDVIKHTPYCEFFEVGHYMRCNVVKILHFLYEPLLYNTTICVVPDTFSNRTILIFLGKKDDYTAVGHPILKGAIAKNIPQVYDISKQKFIDKMDEQE